ncbi:MAG: metallophosphoesterase [Myxococcota bacterium]|nr:metallophosphoesterase [Myxococcota bacterium]
MSGEPAHGTAAGTETPGGLFLLGDVHGRWEKVAQLLASRGWLDRAGRFAPPAGSHLIQLGDLVDRGTPPTTLPLLDHPQGPATLLRQLAAAGVPDTRLLAPPAAAAGPVTVGALLAGRLDWPAELRREEQRHLLAALDVLTTLRLFLALQAQAADAGARLTCLLGNHEVDLLGGEPRYFVRQKLHLLALLGVPADSPLRCAPSPLRGPARLADLARWPELAWLAGLPFALGTHGLLLVHGGPTRRLLGSLDLLGITRLAGLLDRLEEERAAGFVGPLLQEGASLLSPDLPEDDAVADPSLAQQLLRLADAHTLAVGHSPFLHFPKGRWQQLGDPEVRARAERPARLGPGGLILKLDTNLKRGGPAWLVEVLPPAMGGGFVAHGDDGQRLLLEPPPRPPTAAAAGAALPPFPPGIDAERLMWLWRFLDPARTAPAERELVATLRHGVQGLLACGLADLAGLEGLLRHGRDRVGVAARLEELRHAVEARLARLTARLTRRLAQLPPGAPLLFLPALSHGLVAGLPFHLTPVLLARLAADPALGPSSGRGPVVSWTGQRDDGGQAWVRLLVLPAGSRPPLREELHPAASWPPSHRLVRELARQAAGAAGPAPAGAVRSPAADAPSGAALAPSGPSPDAPARPSGSPDEFAGPSVPGSGAIDPQSGTKVIDDPVLQEELAAWLELNEPILRELPAARPGWRATDPRAALSFVRQEAAAAGRPVAERFRLVFPGGRGLPLLRGPDRVLLAADTTFWQVGLPLQVLPVDWRAGGAAAPSPTVAAAPPVDQAAYLLARLPGDSPRLFSAVDEELAALLRAGELEGIGRPGEGRPVWQQGQFLFLSPRPLRDGYFFHKDQELVFDVPRERLQSALRSGLVHLSLFLAEHGETLDPAGTFGGPDVGLEVVACGVAGIGWLRQFLVD